MFNITEPGKAPGSKVAVIVGSVCAVVLALAAIIIVAVFVLKRR
jgi:hypothetical protein